MSPQRGRNVPFTIENYAYLDSFGRETVTWVREPTRDIEMSLADNGGLRLRSGEQRFYEGPLSFPFPMLFSGVADVCE